MWPPLVAKESENFSSPSSIVDGICVGSIHCHFHDWSLPQKCSGTCPVSYSPIEHILAVGIPY